MCAQLICLFGRKAFKCSVINGVFTVLVHIVWGLENRLHPVKTDNIDKLKHTSYVIYNNKINNNVTNNNK